ncbi:hypothetical protein ACV1CZ_22265, partial [Aeromonas caviae]
KQAGKWDQETIVSFFLCQYCSGEYLPKPNIPRKNNSQKGNDDMDWCLYKWRHLVENAFARIKHFRAIATRYDKLLRNYASVLALAFSMMWLPIWSD